MRWLWCVGAIVAVGLASRIVPVGNVFWDKYLGDALYAVLVYCLIRAARPGSAKINACIWAMALMTAIELFQLTLIPARMAASPALPVRILARLLGTAYSPLDLLAYAAGIAVFAAFERL